MPSEPAEARRRPSGEKFEPHDATRMTQEGVYDHARFGVPDEDHPFVVARGDPSAVGGVSDRGHAPLVAPEGQDFLVAEPLQVEPFRATEFLGHWSSNLSARAKEAAATSRLARSTLLRYR